MRCFAATWLVVLATPFLRACLETQASRTSLSYVRHDLPWSKDRFPAAFSIAHLRARFPNDRNVQIAYAEGDSLLFDEEAEETPEVPYPFDYQRQSDRVAKKRVDLYGNLMKRYPNDPVPVARWLFHTSNNFRDVRVAGIIENPPTPTPTPVFYGPPVSSAVPRSPVAASARPSFGNGSFTGIAPVAQFCQAPAYIAPPTPTPTPSPTPQPTPNFTTVQLNRAISIAREGQKLEPNNAYFDWHLIYFLLISNRDTEALRVLDVASRKSRYDDYSCGVLAAFIKARELRRPTLIEEKWTDFIVSEQSFGERDIHIARLLSWIAWQKAQSGDIQTEISIRSDMARLSQTMENGRHAHGIRGYVRNNAGIAWRYDLNAPYWRAATRRSRASLHLRAKAFADYATLHNRPEIARETLNIVHNAAARQKLAQTYRGIIPLGVQMSIGLGFFCLVALVVMLALYVALSLFLLLSPATTVARRDVWSITPVLALFALCGLIVLQFAIGRLQPNSHGDMDLSDESPGTWWLLAIGAVLLFATPLCLNFLWCAVSGWWRERKTPETKKVAPGLAILRVAQLLVCGSVLFYALTYSAIAVAMKWGNASSWTVKIPALGDLNFDEPWQNLPLLWFWIALFSLVSWFLYARIFAAQPRTQTIYALRRFRQTLLALVSIYSICWVLIALLSIPQRRLAEAQLSDLLAHGEVYVAQHQSQSR